MTKFDLAVKKVKVNRATIYINFVELESPMLHAKVQNHRTSSSEEEDFQRFLPYVGMLAMWSCDMDH